MGRQGMEGGEVMPVEPQKTEYLSLDPKAGQSLPAAQAVAPAQTDYLSTDPNAGTKQEPVVRAFDSVTGKELTPTDGPMDVVKGAAKTVWGGVAPFVPGTQASKDMGAQMASGEFFLNLAKSALGLSPEHAAEAQKMTEAAGRGDIPTAARHALGMLPLLGPWLSAQADLAESGKPYEAAGNVLGMAATTVGPAALPKRVSVGPLARNPNAQVAKAVDFGLREGIPVDAGTATGNTLIKGANQAAERMTISGSFVGRKAAQAEAEALAATGQRLVNRAAPRPAVAASAGEATRTGVEDAIHSLKVNAEDPAYGVFHTAAKNPKNTVAIQTGTKQVPTGVLDPKGNPITKTVPITEDIAMPVDVSAIKAQARPIYESMRKWWEPARRNSSAAYTALESIIKGKDVIPAEAAEAALGGLKKLSQEAVSSDLRDFNQGTAAGIVPKLQQAVDAAATKAGKDVVKGLREGRAAHAAKMEAADVLKQLRDEPVQTFNQLTWAGDAGVERLKEVAKLAPKAMAEVGRAYLDKLLEMSGREGAFDHAQRLLQDWSKLGDQTKRILFRNPALIEDLDNFFLLGKKATENMNPSGTAYVGGMVAHLANGYWFHNPAAGVAYEIAGAGLAKLLRSPKTSRLLTRGFSIPISNPVRAGAWSSQLMRAAEEAGVPVSIRAEGQEPDRQ